jgi:hypothetical protein
MAANPQIIRGSRLRLNAKTLLVQSFKFDRAPSWARRPDQMYPNQAWANKCLKIFSPRSPKIGSVSHGGHGRGLRLPVGHLFDSSRLCARGSPAPFGWNPFDWAPKFLSGGEGLTF